MGDIHDMNINSIDLNLLRILHVLSEERSVSRTADRLGLSQPAVSNALKRLRVHLGDELFVRGSDGMSPTPRAAALAAPVSEALELVQTALVGGAAIDPSRIVDPITITVADSEILLYGAEILRVLGAAGCKSPVQFLPLDGTYRADILWRNRLALTITTMLFAPDGLKQRKVYDERLVCLLRADHPKARSLDLDAYLSADHLLIAPLGGAPTGYLDDWLAQKGMSRNIRMISHTFGSAAELVREAGLIASLPSRHAARLAEAEDLLTVPLPLDAPPFSIHLFWSERFDNDPLNKWLRNTICQAMLETVRSGI